MQQVIEVGLRHAAAAFSLPRPEGERGQAADLRQHRVVRHVRPLREPS